MVFPTLPQTAQAEQVPSRVKLTVNPVISISLQNALTVDVLPTQDGTFSSNTAALSISTNNETGYSLYMATGNGENTLTSQNPGTSDVIAAVNGGDNGVTSAGFGNNTWGYNLSQEAVSDATAYKAVPTATGDTAIISTSSPTEADTYNLTFGTKVDTSLPSGTYSNDVVVSVVANPAFVPVFDGIQTMQEMTSTICADAAENDTAQLTDTRDGKKYWVTKLADGNCWMTQNLELDLSGRTLTPADSDVSSNWTYNGGWYNSADQGSTSSTAIQGWNLGNYVWTSPDTYDGCGNITGNLSSCSNRFTEVSNMAPMTKARTDGVVIEGNTYDAHYKTGYYYSWNAATAGSGIGITNRYAASSICPLGWELPANSATFNTLRKQYDASGLLTGDDITTRTPLYFALSGMAFPSTASSNLYGAGDNGYYWSSEAYVFEGIAKGMHLNTYGPENDDRQSRDVGGSIRCVAAR